MSGGGSAASEAKAEETKAAAEPERKEENFNKYDFYSPRKFTKEKIRLLRSIYENYARILTSQENGVFRVMTDITVIELRESRYYEYVNMFHENDCMTIVDAHFSEKGKSNVPLMIYATPGLIITLINYMLGGREDKTLHTGYIA